MNHNQDQIVNVSENATQYFIDNNITKEQLSNHFVEKFNLCLGDQVFFESNRLGYIRIAKNIK